MFIISCRENIKGREMGMKGQMVNFHRPVTCLSISSQEKLYKGCCYYYVFLQVRDMMFQMCEKHSLLHGANLRTKLDSSGIMCLPLFPDVEHQNLNGLNFYGRLLHNC